MIIAVTVVTVIAVMPSTLWRMGRMRRLVRAALMVPDIAKSAQKEGVVEYGDQTAAADVLGFPNVDSFFLQSANKVAAALLCIEAVKLHERLRQDIPS